MEGLPYLLQKGNICRFEQDVLLIGDRRAFPFERKFVACHDPGQIADALRQMVTQGGGPLQVALTTLSYCAHRMERGTMEACFPVFEETAALLCSARPTNTTMARVLASLLPEIEALFSGGGELHDIVVGIDALVSDTEARFDGIYRKMGHLGASLLEDGMTVLTTCFAEHTFLLSLLYAKREGKEVTVLANETRPYLQGARLTVPSLQEMGIPVSLVTDGMGANFLSSGSVGCYMTATDLVCMDGTVVNKTGTLANAIASAYFKVPYYCFSISPDTGKREASDVSLEWRDGKELLRCRGNYVTDPSVEGRYPAFDIVPPSLVRGIVTPNGIFEPAALSGAYQ
jgi:methylthioribose-1-phosphate isomerase